MFKYNYVPVDKLDDKPVKVPLREGKAHFVIKAFYDKDKEGRPLMTLKEEPKISLLMSVTDCQNSKGTIYDTITENMPWKIKQLADSLAMPGIYNESGKIDFSKLVGYEGQCTLKSKEVPNFAPRIIIDKYLPHPSAGHDVNHGPSADDDFLGDDDIPF